ncbi:MAG TPA: carboxylesterase family protein [Vicinamibacterales bacterium]|nr:carboxylesterase family protein [Vicinamibacterales bacterium]
MKRRDFIGYGALAGTGLMLDGASLFAQGARTPGATVDTTAGKLRGYIENGVQVFKGVPYGASTAGANRFMPPQKPQPWTGVRDAFEYGGRAPQFLGGEPEEMLSTDPREAQSEDCLVLNVWTPKPGNGQRRPVMVWFHGGGFASGSGSYSIYSGQELARKHDVVAISVNHRLNIMGYLYLAGFGGKWANASNVGMLDNVRALEWVMENIAAFGGDPGNVTIFGQSGGAGKVSTLMAMPAAKGLFHRAIAQSGAALTATPAAQAMKTTEQVLQRLNIKPDQLEQLQTRPFQELLEAMRPPAGARGGGPGGGGLNFGPVLDGKSLPTNQFDPAAPALSASVPFLTGTTATETTFFTPDARLHQIDEAELRSRVKALVRGSDADADKLIALYRKNQPGRDNIDLFVRMDTDNSFFRGGVETQAERKATQRGAPVYMYRFEYYSPVREGRIKAMHCMEIPFVFDDLEAGKVYTGSGPAAQRIADQMSAAWVAFARTGNPNHRGIPQWTAFNTDQRPTMVFGAGPDAKLINDPGHEERLALKAIRDAAATRSSAQ